MSETYLTLVSLIGYLSFKGEATVLVAERIEFLFAIGEKTVFKGVYKG